MFQTRRMFLGSVFALVTVTPGGAQDATRILTARKVMRRIRPEPADQTTAFTLEGEVPGPVLRLKLGEDLRLRLKNEFDVETSLHWRGVRLANAMDGAAPLTQKPVAPGESFDIAFTPPDAGTFVYHCGLRSRALDQTAAGFSGLLIVEERDPPKVDRDIACLIADWDGAAGAPPLVTLNGALEPPPVVLPPSSRLRLRIASGSARRIMAIGFDGLRAQVAAIDGQPCDLFEPARQTLPVAPGARYDVFFDLPAQEGARAALVLRAMSDSTAEGRVLMSFETKGKPRDALPAIAPLPANPLLPETIALERAQRADLVIEGRAGAWKLNGRASAGLPEAPLFSVKRGAPVSLGFVNRSSAHHHMHVHGHAMRQLHLMDDGWEPYWRDSVVAPQGRTVRVAFVADNPGKWMIESGLGERSGTRHMVRGELRRG